MKMMDTNYEEKYKEALERANDILKGYNPKEDSKATINYIFPELRESEDEIIKKELINYLKHRCNSTALSEEVIECNKWISWLEKQGQKPNPVLDIEIPFGAKDSELQEATYLIPEGFHAEIKDDEVIIKKGKQKPAELHTDEQNLNACLDYIPDEFLKRWLTNIIHVKYEPKFKVGNIISDGNVVYRVDEIAKNAIGQDCYFLVDIEKEKKGERHIKLYFSDGDFCYSGETTWLCEQVDRKFWIKKD